MFIIALIVGGALYYFLGAQNRQKEETIGDEVLAYALSTDVKAGEKIDATKLVQISTYKNAVPVEIIGPSNLIVNEGEKYEYVAKTDLPKNTVLSKDLVKRSDLGEDTRLTEYNMLTLPTTLAVGDTVDIRLRLGNGADFIVVSKKFVENIFGNTISFKLSEDEILLINNAIVEAYLSNTAEMYVVKYVDGIQEKATLTYIPSADVQALIDRDENIVKAARNELNARYNGSQVNKTIKENGLEDIDSANLEAGVKTQLENAKKAREAYLNGLTTY